MRLGAFGLMLCLVWLVSLPGSARLPASTVRPLPYACDEARRICWYVDSSGELQGASGVSEMGMGVAMAGGNPDFFARVDEATLRRARSSYRRIRDTLERRWTVAARMMVSDALHANLSALALSVHQVVTEWNEHVRGRISREIDQRNNVISGVFLSAMGGAVFSMPGGTLLQSAVFQVMMRAVMPMLLESNGYDFSSLPREFSSRIQGLAVDRLESDIRGATDLLLQQVGLRFLTSEGGERELEEASDDQRIQVTLLSSYAGTPYRQADLGRRFKRSRDFRLLYAAKIATILGPRYEEELNSFIVTGFFSEMAWASSGVSARGVIFDLYDVPVESGSGQFSFIMDSRQKRRWRVNARWQLEPRDHGSFYEGRFGSVRLILPYWDEAVKPYGEDGPVLRGNPSRGAGEFALP